MQTHNINFIHKKRDRLNDEHNTITITHNNNNNNTSTITKDIELTLNENESSPLNEYNLLKSNNDYWCKIKSEKINDILLHKKTFQYGNYTKFYYKRYLDALSSYDTKLNAFHINWFKNKRVLDIGCNIGTLTLLIAQAFEPSYIEGIDIDYRLIKIAIKSTNKIITDNNIYTSLLNKQNLSHSNNSNSNDITKDIITKMKSLPKSFQLNLKSQNILLNSIAYPHKINNNEISKLNIKKDKIFFKQQNYVNTLIEHNTLNKFDTIICLDTSKWIHLNYGDIGMKVFFANVYNQLHHNGLFIFEPHLYETYKKEVKLSKDIEMVYKGISFLPNQFVDYLINVYGMTLIKTVLTPSNSKKIYYKTIYILQKN